MDGGEDEEDERMEVKTGVTDLRTVDGEKRGEGSGWK